MLPASVHSMVVNAFKGTTNLKPVIRGGNWHLNASKDHNFYCGLVYGPRA
jgi:hypothetical protein